MFAPPPPSKLVDLPVLPPNWPSAKTTPMLDAAINLMNQPWDPFNRAQHEARMNAWLIQYIQLANSKKLQFYFAAWQDYRTNAQRNAELGLAVTPFTIPAPVLEDVGPMPDGYWFGQHA